MKKITTLLFTIFIANFIHSQSSHQVSSGNFYFTPTILKINLGDTVNWINDGGFHNVNFDINTISGVSFNNPQSFISTPTNSYNIYSHVFSLPGVYHYDCSVGNHASNGMVGTIVVGNIYDVVSNSSDHTKLKMAIDTCSLDGVLSGPGPFTLFAPTDAAFNLLPPGTVASLLNNIPQLTDILKHHVLGDSIMSSMLSNGQLATTLLGTDITVSIVNNDIFIDNAQVIFSDIVADNGVVHVIDAVLLPPKDCAGIFNGIAALDACGTCHQSYVYAGMGVVNYIDTYSDTLAFSGTFVLAGSAIDIMANPNWISDSSLCPNTIYDIVSNSSDHTKLKMAIDTCSLDGVLSGPGPFTLFAPTDAAFGLLSPGTVASLLSNIPQLTDILKHHVLGDSIMSGMLSNGQLATTLLGTDITVSIVNNDIFIDNAQVIFADIVADNGVVHVIDAVLFPNTTSLIEGMFNQSKKYLYSINMLGEKVDRDLKNQIIFDVFEDGSSIKYFNR